MVDKTSVLETLDDIIGNSGEYQLDFPSKDTPLYFVVTFYKKLESIRNPATGKMIEFDIMKCFEFPQFACAFEPDFILNNKDEWQDPLLFELVEYLKLKSESLAKYFSLDEVTWIDNVTARFCLKV